MKKHKKTRNTLCILLILFLTLLMPFSFVSKKTNINFEYVMKGSITNQDAKVVDIKMLGAHDAFTEGIKMSSKPNEVEGGIVTNKAVNLLAKGLVVRMTKTQNVNATLMLKAGVRYFDVRASKIEDKYYATHGYIGKEIIEYVKEIVDFLGSHDGEFIIFDLQHFYTSTGSNYDLAESDYQEFLNYMNVYKNDKGKTILDYVHYDAQVDNLSSLTYKKVIGEDAGVIILAKCENNTYIYKRDNDASKDEARVYSSIRSYWHNDNGTKKMLTSIEEEYKFITSHDYADILRVNQAQKTGFIMNLKLLRSMFSWSLLDMASFFNQKMVSNKDLFMKYLDAMPIYMADYVTSNRGNFNKLANEWIIEANNKL
ncbi:MAG: hypothetical protein J5691_08045 [Bacilli bacterium]|nr:hypothetical protein [Bacilli bacterium]